jgi:hypothetical protein
MRFTWLSMSLLLTEKEEAYEATRKLLNSVRRPGVDRSQNHRCREVLSGWFHATSKSADRCLKNICFWNGEEEEDEDEEDGNGVAHYPELL